LDDTERQLSVSTLGNILYLNGLALTNSGTPDETIENFQRLVSDPELSRTLEPVTLLNVWLRLGEVRYEERLFTDSEEAFSQGVALLQKTPDREHEYRIRLELGHAKAKAMAEDPDDPDYEMLFDQLAELKEQFATGYPDFAEVLKGRVAVSKELDDERYVECLQELRDYLMKKLDFTGQWQGADKENFMQASALLIKHHLDHDEEPEAKEVLLETRDLADPPYYWFNRFPSEFRKKALENSVLDKNGR
jgi:hypothetical protein